jgi:hypothetical protein
VTDLDRLRHAERAKRLLIVGVLAIVYGTGWLVFDHHATRIGETVGTVSRIYKGDDYTVDHVFNGVEHNAYPGRIPDSMGRPPVGSPIRIYFYRNDPDRAFFEPRRHLWPQPIAVGVVVLGLAALGEALRRALLARGRPAVSSDTLVIPISSLHWFRTLAGGVFVVLLLIVIVLSMHLGWTTGGPMGLFSLVFLVLIHGGLILSILAVAYVDELVFDPGRDLIFDGWGLGRSCLFSYRRLSDLVRLETRMFIGRRNTKFYRLVLHFKDGSEVKHSPDYEMDNPSAPEQRIREWLESRSIKLAG